MKTGFSILFALLILGSGMHFSIATHFCGGEVSSKKISVTGSVASCGMETNNESDCPSSASYNSNCCKNQIETYSINTNYENVVYKITQVAKSLENEFYIPLSITFNQTSLFTTNNGDPPPVSPPAGSVDLAQIRVFRI